MPARTVRIGVIGDFNPEYRSHHATNAALQHAAARLGLNLGVTWLATGSFAETRALEKLAAYDGLWAASGSPYGSMEGALAAIRFARVREWPFVGT